MKKSKLIILSTLAVFFISIVLFLFSLFYGAIKTRSVMNLDASRLEVETMQHEFQRLKKEAAGWSNIQKTYESFKKDYLPPFSNFPDLRIELKDRMRKNYLQIVKVDHHYKNLFENIVKVNLAFILKGGYKEFKRFIYEMENRKELLFFEKVQFKKLRTTELEGTFSMEGYFVR